MKFTCGFVGCGNMGGALLRAAAKAIEPKTIAVTNRTAAKAESLAAETGTVAVSTSEVVGESKFIFLGVKPQMLPDLVKDIAPMLKARKDRFVLVTMIAGVNIEKLNAMLDAQYPIIKIMPNTPVSVGEGMILYAASKQVESSEVDEFLHIMSCAGVLDNLDEKLLEAGGAVSGCGPAFAYMFIEALADGGVQCGLPRAKAMTYAAQMLLGSAKLMMESGQHPGALKDAVCSPGGTTIVGVHKLEQSAFRGAAAEAVIGAYKRTMELAGK